MIETSEFFSFHFIAHSCPPPSWMGCSQSVRPFIVFDRSAHLCEKQFCGCLVHAVKHFHSIVWWLLVQASPSCPGQLPPLSSSVFSAIWQFLALSNWLQECPVDGNICHIFQWRIHTQTLIQVSLLHLSTDGVFMWTPTQPIHHLRIIGWAEIQTWDSQFRCRHSNHYSTSSCSI